MADLEARLAALEQRVGMLEDINAIRRLHWAYGYYIDFNRAEDVVQLFAEDGAVVFLSGEYRRPCRGVGGSTAPGSRTASLRAQRAGGRLAARPFPDAGHHHRRAGPAERQGALPRPAAWAARHEIRATSPRVMPLQFCEAGVYENDYVREAGMWKIKRLDYMMQWQADYEKGWAHTVAHLQPARRPIPTIRSGRTVCCRPSRSARPGRIGRTCRCTSRIRASARCLPGKG